MTAAAPPAWQSLSDLVELISAGGASVVLPSAETILTTLQQRYKAEQPYSYAGATNLVVVNPLRVLGNLSDATAAQYERGSATAWGGTGAVSPPSASSSAASSPSSANPTHHNATAQGQGQHQQQQQPHPYELAGRIYTSMQRNGKSQAIVFNGLSGSGKTYTASLVTSQLLRIAQSQAASSSSAATNVRRVTRLAEQIKASHTLLDAFGAAKTATTASATRQGRLFELHYSREDSITSILSGAKVLTWGFDRSRLCAPLGKEERSFHVFYQFLAGASAQERESYHLLEDPSEYDLLASSGTYRLPAGATDDGTAFNELREAFSTLGFKPKHVEMIYKLLSTILLLGNVTFAATADQTDSLAVSPESRPAFEHVAEMLGLPMDELERALVNKTTYVRKEVVCALLTEDGAHKQRDSLMCSLYAILFSYIVESANHRLFPGDEAVKKLQRDNGGTSIVFVDLPGFQMKSPSGGMTGDLAGNRGSSVGSLRRSTLIQAYGEDGYEQFGINYSNELLQHWLNRRAFKDDSHDLLKRAVADGVKLPEVDSLDTSSMTLELLRGGGIGSRADTKPGGLLGGLTKTCSNLRKGKVTTEDAADASFMEGLDERFSNHSRFIPRVSGGVASTFAIKHYAGTVSYSSKSFVEKDSDMFDSDFVRLFRTASSEVFLAKLFSGPSLAAESHPRDPAVIVAAQVSSQPLRRLSPLKVSRTSSTSVPSEAPEPEIAPVTAQLNETLTETLGSLNEVPVWSVSCIRPNDNALPGVFDIRRARNQLDALDIRSLIAKKRIDYPESYDFSDFIKRYKGIGAGASAGGEADAESIAAFLQESKGLARGTGFAMGSSAVWLSFSAWKSLEGELRATETREIGSKKAAAQPKKGPSALDVDAEKLGFPGLQATNSMDTLAVMGGAGEDGKGAFYGESQDDLLKNAGAAGEGGLYGGQTPTLPYDNDMGMGRPAPNYMRQSRMSFAPSFAAPMGGGAASDVWGPEWNGANGGGSQPVSPLPTKEGNGLPPGAAGAVNEKGGKKGTTVEELPTSFARRAWLILVWAFTWWIPTFTLTYLGRMKRPDVRLAWREKVTLCMLIALICGSLLFMILGLTQVTCPDRNKVWNIGELGYHSGRSDYYVGVAGKVYDLTNFYRSQHSDIVGMDVTAADMLELGGQDLTGYFPVPLTLGCPGLVTDTRLALTPANFTPEVPTAMHISGVQQSVQTSNLHNTDWYTATFLPKMQGYYKGPIVFGKGDLAKGAENDGKIWGMYRGRVYDLSDYVYSISQFGTDTRYQFLPEGLVDVFRERPGEDLTSAIDELDQVTLPPDDKAAAMNCLQNVFYRGASDFRTTPRCTVPGYFLLAFTVVLITTIAAKFIAALQLTKKRNPELQDKFVILQVPCYTEGEESLKKTIDSLANLKYDDKRKLLFVICDGMIVGSGNDRPTPRIVLDILGVENLDPDPLLFKSLGQGNKQLNYGKVYSGLYEFEGHVLPYIVVVKVGKPSERSKPGNRGKRDSQILLMRFLNRVHFEAEMAPLELEICHQIKNVIGVDPKLYEFLLTVDADTEVRPDGLNRLVAAAADDQSIIGICGETRLSNEQESWWTMIQVYEYFISHHMAKAFESLFGSVTCLPGCFTMFRLRTVDKGRPLLISNLVIDDYSENDVDTLHKKNLLHLGEDRYLTTLILKHFPHFRTKFAQDAKASTAAPERWNILLSQRRRWINSTVHNLFELVALKDLCGFCCFSMRFIVLIDLLGTILLPATTIYLIYLIVVVATGSAAVPVISLILIGAVYGLQVIIFLLKRQWQFIGWLVIYILAFPVYSFFLPLYSFWHFDDFSWGNTRIVVGEGKNKKVLAGDDDHFDDSMIPLRKFSDYQQQAWDDQAAQKPRHSPQPSEAGFSLAPSRMGHSPHGSFGGNNMMAARSRPASRAPTLMNYPTGPQPAFSPFNQQQMHQQQASFGGAGGYHSPSGSQAGSEFGVMRASQNPFAQHHQSHMSFGGGYGGPGSMLGMPQSNLGMPNMPYAGASAPSQLGGMGPGMMSTRNSGYSMAHWAGPQHGSSYSLAGAGANPFSDQNQATQLAAAVDPANPTDEEILTALRTYLRTQDLLQVTKRTTREAMAQQFPKADLSNRKNFLNSSIDGILAGQL